MSPSEIVASRFRGRGPQASSDSGPEAELQREAKKAARQSTEPTRRPSQKEKRGCLKERP